MSDKYDVVIIGAGIGGLVCGCYLTKAGLKVLIVEKNDKPGGYCTSFERDGYRFDVGVHYLGGIKRGVLGKILEELGVKEEMKFNQFDPTDKIIMPDRITYIRANPYDTIREFKKSFPKEKHNIDRFFKFLMQKDFFDIYKRIKTLSFKDLLDSFLDRYDAKGTLSSLLTNIGSSPKVTSALTGVIFFREFLLDPGYYPDKGMQQLPDAILSQFKKYGGEVLLRHKVERIITGDNKVKGVLINRKFLSSEYIVSNCDATYTFCNLLDINSRERRMVKKLKTSLSVFATYIGINKDIKELINETCNLWYFYTYDIDDIFDKLVQNIKGISARELPLGMLCFPSTHCFPPLESDKSTIQIFVVVPYISKEFWLDVKETMERKMVSFVKKFHPSITEYIQLVISASPCTFEKYTFNKNGAVYGWESSVKQIDRNLIPQKSSICNLFVVGHWCTSGVGGEGGISGVANLGRNVARIILNNIGKEWREKQFLLGR